MSAFGIDVIGIIIVIWLNFFVFFKLSSEIISKCSYRFSSGSCE